MVEPLSLDPLPVAGATLFGVRVVRVRVELEDGRTQRLELPAKVKADDERDKGGMILDVLGSLGPGERIGGKALSLKAGVKWNSNTRTKLFSMVRDGLISHDDAGYGRSE